MTRSKIRTSGAEGLTLSSTSLTVANGLTLTDGDVTVASGHGVTFAATSDASGQSSELFDDYEEGTWTPTSVSNITSISNAEGAYTKIGRIVHVLFYASINPNDTSSAIELGGLPFTAANNLSQTSIEGSGIAWSDDRFYVVSTNGGTGINIEIDRELQGTVTGSSHNFRCDFTYFT